MTTSPSTVPRKLLNSPKTSSNWKRGWPTRVWTCKSRSRNSSIATNELYLSRDILFQDPIATYNPAPISNLTDALPEIAFNTYFSTFTPRNFPTRVILTSTTYAASLSEILAETSHETVEVYLEVRAALALASHLGATTEAWKAVRSLQERLNGIKPGAVGDRAEYCVGRVEDALGFAAGRYFVKEVFNGDSREKGTKVITGACNPVFLCAKLRRMVC